MNTVFENLTYRQSGVGSNKAVFAAKACNVKKMDLRRKSKSAVQHHCADFHSNTGSNVIRWFIAESLEDLLDQPNLVICDCRGVINNERKTPPCSVHVRRLVAECSGTSSGH
eukprot:6204775-Pleurochrysis_carterae.AAC.1